MTEPQCFQPMDDAELATGPNASDVERFRYMTGRLKQNFGIHIEFTFDDEHESYTYCIKKGEDDPPPLAEWWIGLSKSWVELDSFLVGIMQGAVRHRSVTAWRTDIGRDQ